MITSRARVAITVVLGDLVSSRLVLVKVMFSVEPTGGLDVAVEGNGSAQSGQKCRGLESLRQTSAYLDTIHHITQRPTG